VPLGAAKRGPPAAVFRTAELAPETDPIQCYSERELPRGFHGWPDMQTSDTDAQERTLDRVRAILAHRVEERITEHEAIDELIAEIEAAGFDVIGSARH
jgi:hypothetical protein